MKIIAIGDEERRAELRQRINLQIHEEAGVDDIAHALGEFDVIFDLNFDDHPHNLHHYIKLDKIVVVNAVKLQLASFHQHHSDIKCRMVGMNALPTFINRPLAELSLLNKGDKEQVEEMFSSLEWNVKFVEDRVGLVTPRIIFMIINEACYTLQEGTATASDIDQGMKLGTNYPLGPFEWADRVGIRNVYETLLAVYEDTKDERYKICPLLKTHYLKRQPFYA